VEATALLNRRVQPNAADPASESVKGSLLSRTRAPGALRWQRLGVAAHLAALGGGYRDWRPDRRVAHVVEVDVALDPVRAGFPSAVRAVLEADGVADSIEDLSPVQPTMMSRSRA